jgi:hypothetical protein
MGRMRGIIEEPTGLRYVPSLFSEDQKGQSRVDSAVAGRAKVSRALEADQRS